MLASSLLLLAGCAAPTGATIPLEISEADIEEAEVPSAALAALRDEAGGRAFDSLEREDRGAYVAYEAEWLVDGVEFEATVLADGTLIETGRELTAAEMAALPSGVRARVAELEAEGMEVEVGERAFVYYDVDAELPSTGEERELLVRPDGTIGATSISLDD